MNDEIVFRKPAIADGRELWRIVKDTGVLDVNSAYLYLLLCEHFADTCVVAERAGKPVGFVSGYRPPHRPQSIFLWQIGIDAALRGQGLGKRLVHAFLNSPGACGTDALETTISPSNTASQALFQSVARALGAELERRPGFAASDFPPGHEAEELYRIHPLPKPSEDLR